MQSNTPSCWVQALQWSLSPGVTRNLPSRRNMAPITSSTPREKPSPTFVSNFRRQPAAGRLMPACAGAQDSIRLGFDLLATSGAYVSVGLIGTQINIPLFPFVAREFTYQGSFWGNYGDLAEVVALAQARKIKHSLVRVPFEDINKHLEQLLRDGDIVGRAVVTFGEGTNARKNGMVA
jgi:hypothetical protein